MPTFNLQKLPTVAPAQGNAPALQVDTRGTSGEAIAGQVMKIASLAAEGAIKAKGQADLAAVEDAETDFQRQINDQLYGSLDGKVPGFTKAQGHDALERAKPTLDELRKAQGEIAKGLTGDQREAFLGRSGAHLATVEGKVQEHVGAQRVVVEGQSFDGKRLESLRTVAYNWQDPNAIATERRRMEPFVMLEAKRRGLEGWQRYPPAPDSPAAVLLNGWRAEVAKTVLDQMIAAKDSQGARAFLDAPLVSGEAQVPRLAVPPGGTPHDLTKPILENPDGSWSTEKTATVEADGKHLVIPTIVGGKDLGVDGAIAAWKRGENQPVGTFDSADAADAYAQDRHLEEQRLRGGPRSVSVRQILGTEADGYTAKVGHLQEQIDAFDVADKAIEAARDPKTKRINEARARELVRSAPPAYRKEARANLEGLLNGESESWKRQLSDTFNRASAAYYGGPDGKGKKGLGAIDSEDRRFLVTNDLWHHMVTRAHADAEHAQGAKPTPEQESFFSRTAIRLVDEDTRGEYLKLTPEQFDLQVLSHVAPRDRHALLGHYLQTKGQAAKPDESLPATVMHEIVQVGRESGAFPKKGTPDAWGPRAGVHAQVVRELLAEQAEAKRSGAPPIKPEEWAKKVRAKFRAVEVADTNTIPLFGSNDVVPEAVAREDPAYKGKEFQPAIPAEGSAEREAIVAKLKKQGLPWWNPDVVRWWMLDEQGVKPENNPVPPMAPAGPTRHRASGLFHD